ncbi:(poly)ribitol-phosphate teichoic acid beta-D-glucosyltransferase TarQ [Bacillus inaquosorum]|uniref:(poly)ribitol-phosphate teichoic acid beta-D-glucosyltransferase TarQ n=1 Tax=Bacillus inaquosorum TaxID=483913 RepID=UPI002281874E|nr:(poly)ribitol-phosphate teichoic acid beta-D-glucosyltransferase TarQ [Bacillus inaquosorum]MCY7750382.1 (poly)ribitol-phosphate teichoic acid beta-D-glucosyltransferase TarQ [Bacillus inaquosorum]MCY8182827.1 (poly)ribitol-phosphate teichoic acid beta-D-glucosyltransferase TarQ [Bacillus inaquosorum]MCY8500381.1 (poly)ribitol-phosphate teichoic acid beta-D-glucosyltransferase TarQ [Bacillus inaquosorum]MCY8870612.1 (poly)ribitol-phosphate teichoic acid beta-D-glucosyltransferase TarQ [Bacil
MKISIVIPVYNSEDLISECLDSLVNQTMPKEDYEIICVDDKSTDSSLDILNQYKKKYDNIVVVERTVNSGGPGAPRNDAIKIAQGEYILFVDSDDYIGNEALLRWYNFSKENQSDITLGKLKGINGRGVPKSMFKETNPDVDLVDSKIVFTLGPQKLFKASLLKENQITFPTHIKAAEDQVFTMNAYLKAKKISVSADYDYYYLVKRDGEHMSVAYVPPENFYGAMEDIISAIKASELEEARKIKLMAVFLNRHFDFSRTKNVTIKMKTDEERAEWFKYLSSFIHAVPEEADQFVLPHIKLRLLFIRNNDLQGLTQFEREEQDIKKFCTVNNGELIARYPSLERYPISEELLKVNYKNKLEHYLQNIEFSDNSLNIQGTIKHKLVNDETNNNQSLTGVFVHRDTKAEKYISPGSYENSTFTFECKFDELASAEEDLGVWDFFIESSIDGYKLRARIGNKRAAYKYSTNTVYLGHNALFVYSARPYFTMNYDNLSIDIKKHAYTEAELSYETESKDLSFIFKDKQICLPNESKIIVNTGQSEISLPVKRIDLEPNCTKLTVNMQSLLEQLAHVKKERLIDFAINTSQNKISAKVDNQAIILDTKSVERKSMLFFSKTVEVQYKLLTSKSKFYFQY